MTLELDDAETTLLRDILTSAAGDLRYEISDTDNPRFKANLRERRSLLEGILAKLGGPAPA